MSELSDVRDRHYEGVRGTDLEVAAAALAPDVENVLPGMEPGSANGVEGWKRFAAPLFNATDRIDIEILSTIESGDTIVSELTLRAAHTGPLEGPMGTLPATGRQIELPCCDIFRVRAGQAVAHHLYFDMAGLLAQLGLTPAAVE